MTVLLLPVFALLGQDAAPAPVEKTYPVPIGTKVLLAMVNSVSTKTCSPATASYLETT